MRKKPTTIRRAAQAVSAGVRRERLQTPTQAGQAAVGASDRVPGSAGTAAKSLMKTSALATRVGAPRPVAARPAPVPDLPRQRRRKAAAPASTGGRQQKIEERIAAASEELASGIAEAASAAEELRRTIEQIAAGAEEAASASQETLAVATNTAATLAQARDRAETSRRRTDALQGLLA